MPYLLLVIKFGLSEKHRKVCAIFLMLCPFTLVNVQTMRKIFSNFACFSESPNFKMSTRKKMSFVKSYLMWTLLNSLFSTSIRRISSALKTIFGSALRTMLALSSWVPVPTFSYVHTPSCHTSIQTCFVKNFWEKFSLNS